MARLSVTPAKAKRILALVDTGTDPVTALRKVCGPSVDAVLTTTTRMRVCELGRGHVVVRLPYSGSEQLPIHVLDVVPARAKGYMILFGTDATGRRVQVPMGHREGTCTVAAGGAR
jgi:hypothetical protein